MKITDDRERQKKQKRPRGTEPILKAWELNDFAVHLS